MSTPTREGEGVGSKNHDPDAAPGPAPDDKPQPTAVESSRWFVLAETADGYELWQRDADPGDPPLAVFSGKDQGFEAADLEFHGRTRQMRLFVQVPAILAWVVAISVLLWFSLVVFTEAWAVNETRAGSTSGTLPELVPAATQVAYSAWIGSLGVMVMLWLLRRSKEEAPPRA